MKPHISSIPPRFSLPWLDPLSGVTRLTAPFTLKTMGEEGSFQGYASVFGELDTQGDRVQKGAFAQSLEKWKRKGRWPKMLWQHNQHEPLGYWKTLYEDHQGLYVEGQLLLDVQRAREAHSLMKAEILDGLSIGCQIIEAHKGESAQERILSQVELFEVSLVTFAANPKAQITQVKRQEEWGNPSMVGEDPFSLMPSLNHLVHQLKHQRGALDR